MKATICLVVAALLSLPLGLAAQDEKSPDQQQQRHSQTNPPPQANAPDANQTQPQSGTTTAAGTTDTHAGKHTKKRKTARQAHGTPDPGK